MTKTTPTMAHLYRSSTSTGDPFNPPTNKLKHMITKVVNQQSVTFWYYKLNITHSINKDRNNRFLSIERLLDAVRTKNPTMYITHDKSGGRLTQEILRDATSIMDICTSVTGLNNSLTTTLCFCLQSTDPSKSSLYDPLDELRVSLPNYSTYRIDSFCGEPVCMIGIIANVPFRNVDWKTTEGVLRYETERDTKGRTTIKIKPIILDFQMNDGRKRMAAVAIFGTRADEEIVRGKMIKICHDQILRNECQSEEGIFVSMKELFRKGKTCDHILSTH